MCNSEMYMNYAVLRILSKLILNFSCHLSACFILNSFQNINAAQEIINIFSCFVCYANLQSLYSFVLLLWFSLVFGSRTALTDWSCGGTHKQNHNNLNKFKYRQLGLSKQFFSIPFFYSFPCFATFLEWIFPAGVNW